MSTAQDFLTSSLEEVARYKALAEKTFAQLDDADFYFQPDPESNSIAMLIQHIGGNLSSRWTNFLTTDGEKPGRERDAEFEAQKLTRVQLMKIWEAGFAALLGTLQQLTINDLEKTVTIRGQPHTVTRAIQRGLAHLAYHVGQIVFLGKSIKRSGFTSLTIPRGQSKAFKPS